APEAGAVCGRTHARRTEVDLLGPGSLRPARAGRRRSLVVRRIGGPEPVLASNPVAVLQNRAVRALTRPANWLQLLKFGVVGLSGYAVNLVVYTALLGIGAHKAAVVSFVVSAANNYWWNRHWTFVGQKGSFAYQGMRFFAVSVAALLVG